MGKVFVKYGFMFDPDEAWSEFSDFEQDLAGMLAQRGLKAELVETVDGQEGMNIINIFKDIEPPILEVEDTREKVVDG